MGQIDRAGTFRGNIVESSFGLSKNGFPQFIARLQADEMFLPGENGEPGQWVDWSKYDETEIIGYFILAGKDGQFGKNAEQLRKSIGWSGTSFSELDETDYSEIKVQFRVKLSIYNNKPDHQVCWIDHADADPNTTLRKMEKSEVKSLDAKWAKAFKAFSGGTKPKSVPAGKPTPPVSPSSAVAAGTSEPATPPKRRGRPPLTKPVAPESEKPVVETPVGIAAHLGLPATCVDAEEAWSQVEEYVSKDFPKTQVEETWLKAVEDLGGPEVIEKTGNWATVRDIVLETMTDDPIL